MDGVTLLRDAMAAGLAVERDGPRLVIRGPRRLEPLAKAVLARKSEILPLLAWDEAAAERLLRETLGHVAAAYRPQWSGRLQQDSARWLEVEGQVEAAWLLRDMPAFIRALVGYEDFARRAFEGWAP